MEQLGGSNEEEAIKKKELVEKTKYRDKDQTEQKNNDHTTEAESLYLELKSTSAGFSQFCALSPPKRARFELEARK